MLESMKIVDIIDRQKTATFELLLPLDQPMRVGFEQVLRSVADDSPHDRSHHPHP